MAKIIKISENDVFIGKDDGSFIVADKTELDFIPVIGENVELFSSNGVIVVSKSVGGSVIQVIASNTVNKSSKSRAVALILWIFLGWIGGHLFYAGKVGLGFLFITLQIVCLFVTVLSLGLGVFIYAIPVVWTFVDLYYILAGKFMDSDGLLLSEW